MKKLTLILFLFVALVTNAQEYSYEITSESGDSTFQLDIITELTDTRSEINRTTGLDTLGLQLTQYAKINRLYQSIAKLEMEKYKYERQINSLRSGLNEVGLNNYNQYKIEELDSIYASDLAVFSTDTGVREIAYILSREGNSHIMKRESDNENIVAIIPLSSNYIRVVVQSAFQIGGVTSIYMYSSNSKDFRGEDINGVKYRIRITR